MTRGSPENDHNPNRGSQTLKEATIVKQTLAAIIPTYGAYSSNTLPRGPYLQYKYGDDRLNAGISRQNLRSKQHNPNQIAPGYDCKTQRQEAGATILKYATIANPKLINYTRPMKDKQQQDLARLHQEPELIIGDNNSLQVNRKPMTTGHSSVPPLGDTRNGVGPGDRGHIGIGMQTQTLTRYQYDNMIKRRTPSSSFESPSPNGLLMRSATGTRTQSKVNTNTPEINLNGGATLRSGVRYLSHKFSISQAQSDLYIHSSPDRSNHKFINFQNNPWPACEETNSSNNRPPGAFIDPCDIHKLTYQSLPRSIKPLEKTAHLKSNNYKSTISHQANHHFNSNHPQRDQQRLHQRENPFDSSASIFNVNGSGPGGSYEPPPYYSSMGESAVYNFESKRISSLPLVSDAATSTTLLAQSPQKRNQYLSGLWSSNNHLIMEWHREVATNGLSNNGIAVRHSSSPVSSSAGSIDTPGSRPTELRKNKHRGPLISPSSSYNSTNDVSFVTLDEVFRVYPGGLRESEGWALLCQSVQALQDLFLADTPSTSRILPLVTPNSLQITGRGRVAFNIIPVGQLGKYKLEQQANNNRRCIQKHAIMEFLSPEFLQSMGKRDTFSESDIEKMWIFSLGVTLSQAVAPPHTPTPSNIITSNMAWLSKQQLDGAPSSSVAQQQLKEDYSRNDDRQTGCSGDGVLSTAGFNCRPDRGVSQGRGTQRNTLTPSPTKSTLQFVIKSMCNKSLEHRASLMYLLDLNEQRTSLRRQPQSITSLRPEFDQDSFNFTKIRKDEHLFDLEFKGGRHRISFIVNSSPLTKNHCLVVPDLAKQSPQVLSEVAIEYSLALLAKLDSRRFRMGFNSPGALASVNHLHLHVVDVTKELFSEHFRLKDIGHSWYILDDPFPSLALVHLAYPNDVGFGAAAKSIMKIIDHLCDHSVPHNVFFTWGTDPESNKCIRTIIYPRDRDALARSKSLSGFNIACFELGGYIPVGTDAFYNDLSEEMILNRIECEMGKIDFAGLLAQLVISDYCRTHHQVKPFSHIVMDLFQGAAMLSSTVNGVDEKAAGRNKLQLDEKNDDDADSGRSSDHGLDQPPLPVRVRSNKLEVHRLPTIKSVESSPAKKRDEKQNTENVLQVVRRKRRRETFRRNTIDVNRIDLDEAQARLLLTRNSLADPMNVSKSTNCIDKLLMEERNEFHRKIEEMTFQGGTSLPDLSTVKILGPEHKTRLTVKRQQEPVCGLKIRKCVSTDDFRLQANCGRGRPDFTGPDFMIKAFAMPKQIDLTSLSSVERNPRFVNVLLLNGRTIVIRCNANTITAEQILRAVYQAECYEENYFLGLCIIIGGDFVFLPMDFKVHKVAPSGWTIEPPVATTAASDASLSLFIRVKFYLPTLRGLNSFESRHMMYLQLRKSVLEKQILCTADDLILLGGLALQAEVGDFQENMKYVEYFTVSHYLPEGVQQRNRELAKYLRNSHYVKRGLHPVEAEHNYIRYVQEMKEFGLHLYSAVWSREDGVAMDVFLAISISGMCLFERGAEHNRQELDLWAQDSRLAFRRKLLSKFEWLEIENLCYSKHILCIVVRNRESLTGKDNSRVKYKLRMDGKKSYFAFCLASDHHRFYMKLRNSFVSLKEISNEFNISVRTGPCPIPSTEVDSIHGSTRDHDRLSGSRFNQIKKSMLNENKLGKLRRKFLKRSKSVMELSSVGADGVKEEDFKENLNPLSPAKAASSVPNNSQTRNKVKMGTRAFSSQQFLNRSFDNICDNAINLARVEGDRDNLDMSNMSFDPIDEMDSEDEDAIVVCNPQTRVPKHPEMLAKEHFGDAYVLQQSVASHHRSVDPFAIAVEEETISESLLEKFNNLSSTGMEDRVIRTLKITKNLVGPSTGGVVAKSAPKSAFERFKFFGANRFSRRFLQSGAKKGKILEERDSNGGTRKKYSLGVSIVQGPDGNIYVKDLVPGGAGDRQGIKIGDQILAVSNKALSNVQYKETLRMLQSNEPIVELTVSQAAPPPIKLKASSLHKSEDNFRSLEVYSLLDQDDHGPTEGPGADPVLRYFSQMKQEQVNRTKERMEFSGNDSLPRALMAANSSLSVSKSVPDLPQAAARVVAIIPKRVGPPPKDGLGRRYKGPVRYPVTPAKDTFKAPLALSISGARESEVI